MADPAFVVIEDRNAHLALQRAIRMGKVGVYTDFNQLNRKGSPVYDAWENVAGLLLPILAGLAVLFVGGLLPGTVALALAALLYVLSVRPYLAHRLNDRTRDMLTRDLATWRRLWRLPGIALVLTHYRNVGCVSPSDDWRRFVHENFPELAADDWGGEFGLGPQGPALQPDSEAADAAAAGPDNRPDNFREPPS